MRAALLLILSFFVGFGPPSMAFAEDEPCGSYCKEMIHKQQQERQQPREPDAIDNAFGALILGLGVAAMAEAYGKTRSEAVRSPQDGNGASRNFVWARINHPEGSDLNLRDGPGFGYPPVATMSDGTRLKIFGCRDYDGERAWCFLEANGYRGWASSKYLAKDE